MNRDSWPHVVKFSGGRSSGMMTLMLLESGELRRERGDVVLFNNTSAEHPKTYEFVGRVKKLVEAAGIPFYITEFQTFEDSHSSSAYGRYPSFRLVNDVPFCADTNPDGYKWQGEVFEEVLSWKAFVPNIHQRVCTASMKVFVTNSFLGEWFARGEGLERLGHYHEQSRLTDESLVTEHRRNRGRTPGDIYLRKKEYLRGRPCSRPQQPWGEYCSQYAPWGEPLHEGYKAILYGEDHVDYVSYIGLRQDERGRYAKLMARREEAAESSARRSRLQDQPPGEVVVAPLIERGVDKDEVEDFWCSRQDDLDLPYTLPLSNCVFCPLKGSHHLSQLAWAERHQQFESRQGTPSSITWWMDMEDRYGRDLEAEKRQIRRKSTKKVGFFGSKKLSFRDFHTAAGPGQGDALREAVDLIAMTAAPACECTD